MRSNCVWCFRETFTSKRKGDLYQRLKVDICYGTLGKSPVSESQCHQWNEALGLSDRKGPSRLQIATELDLHLISVLPSKSWKRQLPSVSSMLGSVLAAQLDWAYFRFKSGPWWLVCISPFYRRQNWGSVWVSLVKVTQVASRRYKTPGF